MKTKDKHRPERDKVSNDRRVQKQHRWKWGQDPNDPDTSDPNWHYIHYDVLSPPPPPPVPDFHGPDSEVTCFECHHNTYRIIKSEPVDITWGYSIGRQEFHDTKLMLICPNCNDHVQMYLSALQRIQSGRRNE